MIVFLGVAGALFLVVAVVAIFYFAGNRGRAEDVETRVAAAKGHHQQGTPQTPRSEGRGDL